jgi:hypothetical protein
MVLRSGSGRLSSQPGAFGRWGLGDLRSLGVCTLEAESISLFFFFLLS